MAETGSFLQLTEIDSKALKITVVPMHRKPPMAVALENPRIRDYPDEIKNTNSLKIILWLLDLLGVKGDEATTEQHKVAVRFLNNTLDSYTYQEIRLAFEKYVKGDFYENGKPMLVTQQLNSVVLGKVMKAYQLQKDTDLNLYRVALMRHNQAKQELSEEDKKTITIAGVLQCYLIFKEQGIIPNGYLYVYDFFYELEKLPKHTAEFKEGIKARALELLKMEHGQNDKRVTGMKKFLDQILVDGSLKGACKRIILIDFLKGLADADVDMVEYLQTTTNK